MEVLKKYACYAFSRIFKKSLCRKCTKSIPLHLSNSSVNHEQECEMHKKSDEIVYFKKTYTDAYNTVCMHM